jgi:hypothetical protein
MAAVVLAQAEPARQCICLLVLLFGTAMVAPLSSCVSSKHRLHRQQGDARWEPRFHKQVNKNTQKNSTMMLLLLSRCLKRLFRKCEVLLKGDDATFHSPTISTVRGVGPRIARVCGEPSCFGCENAHGLRPGEGFIRRARSCQV